MVAVPNPSEFMVFLEGSVHERNIQEEDRSHSLGVQIMSEMGGGRTRSGFPQYINVLCQRQEDGLGKKRLRRHSSREIRELASSLRGRGREGRRKRQVVHHSHSPVRPLYLRSRLTRQLSAITSSGKSPSDPQPPPTVQHNI